MRLIPGVINELKGSLIYLNIGRGEEGITQKEEFRVTEFKESTEGIQVELYNTGRDQLFISKISDPSKIIPDHKMCMKIISNTLMKILTGIAADMTTSIITEDQLIIKAIITSQILGDELEHKFTYKFRAMQISESRRIDMQCSKAKRIDLRFAELEQKIVDLKVDHEARLRKLEERFSKQKVVPKQRSVFPRMANFQAGFKSTGNKFVTLTNVGRTLEYARGNKNWHTMPVDFWMNNGQPFRASFRIEKKITVLCGVISKSFNQYHKYPQVGYPCWMATFATKLERGIHPNGNFKIISDAFTVNTNSIITVEFIPKQDRIHYLLDGKLVGQHRGCAFNKEPYRFAVAAHDPGSKITLLSVEHGAS